VLDLNADAPPFSLDGVLDGKTRRFTLGEFRGHWVVLFFYPADFTFVCPTEIVGFQRRLEDCRACDATVLGISVDDVESHGAWAEELGGIRFPLLADPARDTCRAYGVLDETEQRAYRATVVVSPAGKIAYQVVSPMNVGRSVDETLRVLRALQTGRLCPADWKPGDETLDPELRF
jgi:peroxiredoxin (alkyl hydroperoxide reductase subunit C)